MQTIGVLGGMGPQATMDFEARVLREAQRRSDRTGRVSYPPMIVTYFREVPVVMPEDGSVPTSVPPLNPRLLEAAAGLGTLVDFLVITSNGMHLYQDEIEQAAGKPVLSMIAVTLDEVQRRRWTRVGVLDFRTFGLYAPGLEQRGITPELTPPERHLGLMQAMYAVFDGRTDTPECRNVMQGIAYLRSQRVHGIIPACTEFPLALGATRNAPDLLDPIHLLAEAAVRRALEAD